MEFFREGVTRAQKRANLRLGEDTQFYVVHLLADQLQVGKLSGPGASPQDEPLALLFGKALQAADEAERYRLFKQVGDRSLYVSGFFPDSLKRKLVDIGYYVSLGENAYASVSALARGELFSELFEELSLKFVMLIDVIADVSESSGVTTDQDLLRLYERWLQTRSTRLSDKLREKGILPVECKTDLPH